MKEKIAKIVYDWNCQSKDCLPGEARWIIADQILSLPLDEVITLGDLIRMQQADQLEFRTETPKDEGYYGDEYIPDAIREQSDTSMRVKGWLHRDDSIPNLFVGDRPLTVGEALGKIGEMVSSIEEVLLAKETCARCTHVMDSALTINGEKIRRG